MSSPCHTLLRAGLTAVVTLGFSACAIAASDPAPAPAASGATTAAVDTSAYFNNWPKDADPKVVGKRVADNFANRKFRFEATPQRGAYIIYPEACAWYGALTFADVTHDQPLINKLAARFNPFMTPEGLVHINFNPPASGGVDNRLIGAVPLELYLLTKYDSYKVFGVGFADRQWATPLENGLSSDSRYWVDDLYMLPAMEMQAYRATKDPKYLDRVALTFSIYLDRLQQPNGLFFHGDGAPYYWSRGNGWVAAGITELLRDLPPTHPQYAKIFAGYQKMMAGLLKTQGEDGLWKQLLDHPEAWSETSGSAMFDFAFVTGVKNGWLDAKTYGPAARKAWLGLVSHIDADGNIHDVCGGTNKWTAAQGDGVQYYLNRPKDNTPEILQSSDVLHGNAPVLWTATALLR
ncbi:MAG TPA: glycoside hydrolase family 88 protein [Opitutales bacterium]|nr:glycoside hydrolase family 88 protein [Opitutales bacterium]